MESQRIYWLSFLKYYIGCTAVLVFFRAHGLVDFIITAPLMIPAYLFFERGRIRTGIVWFFAMIFLAAVLCSVARKLL